MLHSFPPALTSAEIARRVGLPKHAIDYLVKARGIQPVSRAGMARVFDDGALEAIRAELAQRAFRGPLA